MHKVSEAIDQATSPSSLQVAVLAGTLSLFSLKSSHLGSPGEGSKDSTLQKSSFRFPRGTIKSLLLSSESKGLQ